MKNQSKLKKFILYSNEEKKLGNITLMCNNLAVTEYVLPNGDVRKGMTASLSTPNGWLRVGSNSEFIVQNNRWIVEDVIKDASGGFVKIVC